MNNITANRINEIKGNLSQEKFAESINSSQSVVSKILNGESPSNTVLVEIAKKYNVSVDWLLGLSSYKYLSGFSQYDSLDFITYADVITMFIYLIKNNTVSYQSEKNEDDSDYYDCFQEEKRRDQIIINDHFLGDLIVTANAILTTCPETITSWKKQVLNDYHIKLMNWGLNEESTYAAGRHNNTSLEVLHSMIENENKQQ